MMDGSDSWRASPELRQLLSDMNPVLKDGEYVFITQSHDSSTSINGPVFASVVEDEGMSLLISRADADAHNVAYEFVDKWITLSVNSDLAAVGLTAAVSVALAQESISCNVIAGNNHDHLIVPASRATEAMTILKQLAVQNG